eukprot:GHVT01020353.1.p1 GENE.GHVT01020353.1~~GHVT01020353.1.p1  ORF type:complete len:494 (+),score=60.99 GHVT01020353.1:554-2035(+)
MKILFHLLLLVGCVLALCMRRPRYFVSAEFFLPSPAPNSTLSSLEPTFTPFSSAPTSTISSSAPTSTLASKAWHSTLTSSAPTSSPFSPATTSSFVASFEQVPAHVALSKEAKFSTRSSRKAASNKLSKAKALKKVKGTKVKRSAKLKLLVGAVVTTLAVATTAGVLLWHFLSKKEEQPGDAQPVASASTTTKGISGSGPASAKAPAEADAKGAPSKQEGNSPTGRKPQADTPGQAGEPVPTGSKPTKKPETAKPELGNPLSSQSKPGSKPAKTPERAEPGPNNSHTPQLEPSIKPTKLSEAKKPKPGEPLTFQSTPGSQRSEKSLEKDENSDLSDEDFDSSRTLTEGAGSSSSSRAEGAPGVLSSKNMAPLVDKRPTGNGEASYSEQQQGLNPLESEEDETSAETEDIESITQAEMARTQQIMERLSGLRSELKNTEKPWTGYNPQQPGRPREHAAMKGLIENETIVQFMKSKSNFTPESETLLRGMLAESV